MCIIRLAALRILFFIHPLVNPFCFVISAHHHGGGGSGSNRHESGWSQLGLSCHVQWPLHTIFTSTILQQLVLSVLHNYCYYGHSVHMPFLKCLVCFTVWYVVHLLEAWIFFLSSILRFLALKITFIGTAWFVCSEVLYCVL